MQLTPNKSVEAHGQSNMSTPVRRSGTMTSPGFLDERSFYGSNPSRCLQDSHQDQIYVVPSDGSDQSDHEVNVQNVMKSYPSKCNKGFKLYSNKINTPLFFEERASRLFDEMQKAGKGPSHAACDDLDKSTRRFELVPNRINFPKTPQKCSSENETGCKSRVSDAEDRIGNNMGLYEMEDPFLDSESPQRKTQFSRASRKHLFGKMYSVPIRRPGLAPPGRLSKSNRKKSGPMQGNIQHKGNRKDLLDSFKNSRLVFDIDPKIMQMRNEGEHEDMDSGVAAQDGDKENWLSANAEKEEDDQIFDASNHGAEKRMSKNTILEDSEGIFGSRSNYIKRTFSKRDNRDIFFNNKRRIHENGNDGESTSPDNRGSRENDNDWDDKENHNELMESPWLGRNFAVSVEPYKIGFPNQGNTCYLNATLQALLGLVPFTEEIIVVSSELSNYMVRNCLFRVLYYIVTWREKGEKDKLSYALRKFKTSLCSTKPKYSGSKMHDASEFLLEILDTIKDEIDGAWRSSKSDVSVSSIEPRTQSEGPEQVEGAVSLSSSQPSSPESTDAMNPVKENFESEVSLSSICTECGEKKGSSKVDYLTFFLDIPKRESNVDTIPSLQVAFHSYMRQNVGEVRCDKCNDPHCKQIPSFSKLPRILIVLLKRYTCQHQSQLLKVTSKVRIPISLSLQNFIQENVAAPTMWTPKKKQQPPSHLEEGNFQGSQGNNEKAPIIVDESEEDNELEEAMRQSLAECKEQEEKEQAELQEAIKRSIEQQEKDLGIGTSCGDLSLSGVANEDDNMEDVSTSSDYSYRLISIVSHYGASLSSGHYVADVFNWKEKNWYHYDDEVVSSRSEDEVLGESAQRNGYIFFYINQKLFDHLQSGDT